MAVIEFVDWLLPVIVSTVAVFVVSAFLHVFGPHHKNDFKQLPDDKAFERALKRQQLVGPGEYMFPNRGEPMEQPGLCGILLLFRPTFSSGGMARSLIETFILQLGVSSIIPVILTLSNVASPWDQAQLIAIVTTGFSSYDTFFSAVWYGRSWSFGFKNLFDGMIYGVITAAVFHYLA